MCAWVYVFGLHVHAVITFTITCIQDTANVQTVAREAVSPQPSIITRVRNGHVKDAFLVIEKAAFPTKVSPKDIIAVLFSSFFVFNVHYPPGCSNFYTMLEVLFLNKKVPARKPRLSAIANQLKA